MELSEAKQRLTYINHAYDYGNIYSRDDLEAIDTVLKALDNRYYEMVMKEQDDIINDLKSRLDNSISKDEVRKKIEEIMSRDSEDCLALHGFQREAQIDVLKELLGEE